MSRLTLRTVIALVAMMLIAALPAAAQAKRHGKSRHGSSKKSKQVRKGDRNRDGLPDRWERANKLSLRVNQAGRDQDHDGLNNSAEFQAGTKPCDDDSDDDGVRDGQEKAGTVATFADGVLTITLFAGGQVTGKVDASTEIECDGDDHGRNRGPGSAHGSSRGEDDGPDHDVNDDKGGATSGSDDGPNHDAGDDRGPAPAAPGTAPAPAPVPAPAACTVADLKPGAIVHEAELRVTQAGAVFHEIQLVPAPVPVRVPAT